MLWSLYVSVFVLPQISFLTPAGSSNVFRGTHIPIGRDPALVEGEEINMEHTANRIGIILRELINNMHIDTEV
jgi:hypothetical protein